MLIFVCTKFIFSSPLYMHHYRCTVEHTLSFMWNPISRLMQMIVVLYTPYSRGCSDFVAVPQRFCPQTAPIILHCKDQHFTWHETQHFEFNVVNAGANIQHFFFLKSCELNTTTALPLDAAAAFIWFTIQRQLFCSCQQNNMFYLLTNSFRFAFVCLQSPHIVICSMD